MADRLQQLTEALAATHTQQQVLTAAFESALRALGAVGGTVLLLNRETQFLAVADVQGRQAPTVWQGAPLSPGTPAGDALLGKRPVYFEHAQALRDAYPHLEEHTGRLAAVATALQPLMLEGQPLGMLILDFKEPHTLPSDERRLLASLAAQTSVALDRAQILQQREAEMAQSRSSEARFRRMVEASPVAMGVGSPDGQLTLVNDAYLKLFGYTRTEYEAGELDWQALTPVQYRAQDRQAFETAFSQGVSTTYEKEMLSRTGEWLPLEVTLVQHEGDQVVGYLTDLRVQKAQERVVTGQATTLLEEQAASQAFMTFTEAASHTTDVQELAQLALAMLQDTLPGSSVAFYELHNERWYARHLTADMTPELQGVLRHGLPLETPSFAEMFRTRRPVFIDQWSGEEDGVEHGRAYGRAALYPIFQGEVIEAALTLGLRGHGSWSEREHTTVSAVGRSFSLLYDRIAVAQEAQVRRAEAQERSQALAAFEQLSRDLVQETNRYTLIERAQEIVLSLLPGGFAVYYELEDDQWRVKAQVGTIAPELQTLLNGGLPASAPSAHLPWTTGKALYQDLYSQGADTPPEASRSVQATFSAALRRHEERIGIFSVGLFEQRNWTSVDRTVLSTALQSLELALDRAASAEQLIQKNAELDARTEALEAFVRFTEASTRVTDMVALADEAKDVLRATLGNLSVGYYELQDNLWKAKVVSEDIPPTAAKASREGFPVDLPSYLRPFQERGAVFISSWDAKLEGATGTEMYGAAAFYPYFNGEAPYGLFSMETTSAHIWTERERRVFLSISRSLGLAIERAHSVQQIQLQKAVMESRNRALETFSTLTGVLDVRLGRYELIRRTQELVLSLLPPGYAAYFEPEHGLWRLKAQTGDSGSAALQTVIEAGIPVGGTPTLDMAMNTGEPYFIDVYAQDTDIDPEIASHLNAAACLPIFIRGQFVGIFNLPLFHTMTWDATDRAVLISAVQSLTLALEGAQSLAELEASNNSLQAANEELEAFTYSASHDLRTPVRHVMAFAELAQNALGKTPNEKAQQHLETVKQASTRMTSLIDGMLILSRSGRQELQVQPVDLNALATQARRDAATEFGNRPVRWQIAPLPSVQGDRAMLQQVMTNLLSNAVKYSAKREMSEISVSAQSSATEWTIIVQDNGVGFHPDYAQRLFGIFQRLHSEKEFKGTGVGLATVKRIVQKHGGRVFAESDGHSGSTFGFTLPK